VAQKCQCGDESCRTWMEDRVGTLVSGNSYSQHGIILSLLLIVDKDESPNAVYQSDGHPIFMIFCCFRILQHS